MSRWFRFYDDALNDPKILKLSDELFRIWVSFLCVASKNEGKLPPVSDLALLVRLKPKKTQEALEKLISAGLIDTDEDGVRPHNWSRRQYKSDVSTERVKRFRNGNVTPPDNRDRSRDRNRKKEGEGPSAPPAKSFYFEGAVIRLTAEGYAKWRDAYPRIQDLRAVLQSRDDWLSQQADRKNWFVSTSNYLANENQKAAAEAQVAKLRPGWTPIPASGII